jgi:hypothetical protein
MTSYLFWPLVQQFGDHQFHQNEEAEVSIFMWLQMQESALYCSETFKLMP